MKKLILSLLTFTFSLVVCNAQTWLWGREGNNTSDTYAVAADGAGNAVIAGYFLDTISFGSTHLFSTREDSYIVEYDSTGKLQWAVQTHSLSSKGYCTITAVTTDGVNFYVTGTFTDSADFGSHKLYSNALNGDVFVAAYNSVGSALWAVQSNTASSLSGGVGYAITYDGINALAVTGTFTDSIAFGTKKLKNKYQGQSSVFLAEFNTSGNAQWTAQGTAANINGFAEGLSVASDSNGEYYVTGAVQDTIYFGAVMVPGNTGGNTFLAKYSPTGGIIWVRQGVSLNNLSYDLGYGVATDKWNPYITGIFLDSTLFGKDTLVSPSILGGDVYLVKYDSAGKLLWVKQSTHKDSTGWSGYSLTNDQNKHLYFSGGSYGYNKQVVFWGDTIKTPYSGVDPSVVLRLDTAGHILESAVARTGGDDMNVISCDPTGKYVYFGGDLADSVTFGSDHLTDNSGEQPFITRWNPFYTMFNEGINELPNNNSNVIVYPNPCNGKFAVGIKSEKLKVNSLVEVYNMLGEKILTASLNPSEGGTSTTIISLPFGECKLGGAGIYLYRVISESGQLIGTGKLIKE